MSIRYQPYGVVEPLCFVDVKASPKVGVLFGGGLDLVVDVISIQTQAGQNAGSLLC
jgi:hypothetical protein